MNQAKESFLFDHQLHLRSADLKRGRTLNRTFVKRRPRTLARINHFVHILNHVRRIRIEVTFDYKEVPTEAAGY